MQRVGTREDGESPQSRESEGGRAGGASRRADEEDVGGRETVRRVGDSPAGRRQFQRTRTASAGSEMAARSSHRSDTRCKHSLCRSRCFVQVESCPELPAVSAGYPSPKLRLMSRKEQLRGTSQTGEQQRVRRGNGRHGRRRWWWWQVEEVRAPAVRKWRCRRPRLY